MTLAPLDVEQYVVTDPFFGQPYVDRDEQVDTPLPHRLVHGGFSGTDTRFTFYFPPAEAYDGRLIQPLEGAHGGHETTFGGPIGELIGGFSMVMRLGGYMVESNQGHIGDDVDPKGGDDPTLYGHRASAEVARFSKHLAAQVYGQAPHHSYVFGGSGGGRRSPLCLEYGSDAWDAALPFMGGGNVEEHGTTSCVLGAQTMSFGAMFNVQRILRDKLAGVVDAMRPGGSGDPYAGLDTHQREELANLYRLGYPRGDEFMIGQPMGQMWLWSSMADDLQARDAGYFRSFWTEPGYLGNDAPHLLTPDLIDVEATITRVLTVGDMLSGADEFAGPEFAMMKIMIGLMSGTAGMDFPVAVEIDGVTSGYRLGTGVRITSGKAAGRQLYAIGTAGKVFQCDGVAEANLERFRGVEVGDRVHVDNRAFLAFCYYYRHHLMDDPQFDFLRVDGVPVYPAHPVLTQSPLMGVPYSGSYAGKLLWVHHTHDASLWPPQGVVYEAAVLRAQGAQGAQERFRLRWTENAEHIPPMFAPSSPDRANSTWLVNYTPIIEQSLADLIAWTEQGTVPAHSEYTYADGKVSLPTSAAERGGIQPVVLVTADGALRTEVPAGTAVQLAVEAEVPPGAGTVIAVQWDFDGSGSFPFEHEVDGTETRLSLKTEHTYDTPGTWFATARVVSHREGDVSATSRRIENVASARVVVR